MQLGERKEGEGPATQIPSLVIDDKTVNAMIASISRLMSTVGAADSTTISGQPHSAVDETR